MRLHFTTIRVGAFPCRHQSPPSAELQAEGGPLGSLLTATSRLLPIFQEYRLQEIFTFLDLRKMLGFEEVTVSDGNDFAHTIHIESS